jgi:hypothetical protein
MARYNMNDRPMPGGSYEERLSGRADRQLNAKLGPKLPRPLVRETSSSGAVSVGSGAARRRSAGLPERFIKD